MVMGVAGWVVGVAGRVTVTVFAPHVSQSQVPSLCRVCRGCHLCVACGVAVALFVLHGVLLVPSLHQVWCCGYGCHATRGVCSHEGHSDMSRVATRGAAMGQPGGGSDVLCVAAGGVVTGPVQLGGVRDMVHAARRGVMR